MLADKRRLPCQKKTLLARTLRVVLPAASALSFHPVFQLLFLPVSPYPSHG
jgi:hypothetical protein